MSSRDEQIWFGQVYLQDYSNAARTIQRNLTEVGWARAKGIVKQDVCWLRGHFNSPCMTPGIIDALLDAVN